MADKTTNEMLVYILEDLDKIIENTQKSDNKEAESPVSRAMRSSLNTEDSNNSIDITAKALKNLASAIITIDKKIDDKKIDKTIDLIKKLGSAVKDFKLSSQELEGFNSLISCIVTLQSTIGALGEHFFKNIIKFNGITGALLGKAMAKFYKNFLKAFEDEKLGDAIKKLVSSEANANTLTAFMSIFQTIMSLNWKQLLKLNFSLKKLSNKAGQNLADFIRPILKVAKSIKEKDIDGIIRTAYFIKVLSSFSLKDILVLSLMGTYLNAKKGRNIAQFILAIVNALGSSKANRAAKNATKLARSIALLIMSLTVSLLLLTALVVLVPLVMEGIGLLALVVAFAVGISIILSTRIFKQQIAKGIHGAAGIGALILALTISLAITVEIADTYKPGKIIGGFAILAILVAFAIGIIFILGKKKLVASSAKSLITVVAIGTLLLALAATLAIVLAITSGEKFKDIAVGIIALAAICGIMIGIVYLFSIIPKKALATGLLGALGLGLVILAIGFSIGYFIDEVIGKITKLKKDDVWDALEIIGAIFGSVVTVVAVVAGIGTFTKGIGLDIIAAAEAIVAGLGAIIIIIAKGVSDFVDLAIKINTSLTTEMIQYATDLIVGSDGKASLLSCITKIIDGLSNVSIWSSIKLAKISKSLLKLFSALSIFVDVVAKMGSLTMIDSFDSEGKPIYKKMSDTEFESAGTKLVGLFMGFIDKIYAIENSKHLKRVLKALKRGGLPNLMLSLSMFVDAIEKMGNLRMVKEYDKDGKPIYQKMNDTVFTNAADTLSKAFGTFLQELQTKVTDSKHLKDVLKSLKKGELPNLMLSLGSFINTIHMLASNQYVAEYDENGNPVFKKFEDGAWKTAASVLATAFTTFLTEIKKLTKDADDINDKPIKNIIQFTNDQLIKFYDNLIEKDYGSKNLLQLLSGLITPLKTFITLINENFADKDASATNRFSNVVETISKSSKKLGEAFKNATPSFIQFNNITGTTVKRINDMLKALKNLDKQIIINNRKRVEAIKNMTDKFSDMNNELKQLNDNIENSINRINSFKDLNKNNSLTKAFEGVGTVIVEQADKVSKTVDVASKEAKTAAIESGKMVNIDPEDLKEALKYALTDILDKKPFEMNFGNDAAKKLAGLASLNIE